MEIANFVDDLLELSSFSKRLNSFIATEHEYVDGGLVIALSSKFGSGKSTFLRMWKSSLESSDSKTNCPLVISLNAWESDYFGDPLFAIVSALAERLKSQGKPTTGLVNAAKDLGWFITAVGGQVVSKVTGIDAVAAGEFAESRKDKRKDSAQMYKDTFSLYQGRKEAMEALKLSIRELVASSEPKVLFLVDELDRCRPDYAIAYLETIKHIFDVKGAVFLLAADRNQLENSARTAFGKDLDFDEYYRKFVNREISLPPISDEGYHRLAAKYVNYYLEKEGTRYCFMKLEQARIDNITELVGGLRLTPRQIQDVFRILGHIFSAPEEKRGRLRWCFALGTIVMAILKVGSPRVFHLLGSQQLEPKEAVELLKSLVGKKHAEWWFMLLLTGDGLLANETETVDELLLRVGLVEKDDGKSARREISQWSEGWGHSDKRFSNIREKIEQISQWS